MIKNKTIIAIGAHPDDIEYYAGGTLMGLSKDNNIYFIIVSNGGLNGNIEVRKKEQITASALIGVKKTYFLNYPDLGLEKSKEKIKHDLLEIILTIKPQIVFSFDPENQYHLHDDFHPDHRTISFIVADLLLLYSSLPTYIKQLGINKPPLLKKPDLWLFDSFQPNHTENISSHWEQKIELLKLFKSQELFTDKIKKVECFNRIIFNDNMKE